MAIAIGSYTEIYTGGYFESGGLPEAVEVYLAGWWTGLDDGKSILDFYVDDGILEEHVIAGNIEDFLIVDPFL